MWELPLAPMPSVTGNVGACEDMNGVLCQSEAGACIRMEHEEPDDLPDFKRLQAIMDGDGSEIRQQFIFAGLLLTIFERFKGYVVNRVDEFLARGFVVNDDNLTFKRSEEFETLIKEKGSGEPGQHGNRVFRAALHWLHDLRAIDKDELDHVERLYTLRNEIGHELFGIIADDRKRPIELFDVVMALSIYVKVVRWWIREIEAAIDPDMTPKKCESTDWDEAESSDTFFLRLILQRALTDNAEWQTLQKLARDAV